MSINILIDSNKKVIGYHGTDIQLKTVDELPEKPEQKVGVNHVAYYNEQINKVEYREEPRELTERELYEKLAARQEATAQAVQEIALNSLGGL